MNYATADSTGGELPRRTPHATDARFRRLRRLSISAQVYQQHSTSESTYRGGGYFDYSYNVQYNNVGGQRRAISAEERANGAIASRTIAAEMGDKECKVSRAMTQKYQIGF